MVHVHLNSVDHITSRFIVIVRMRYFLSIKQYKMLIIPSCCDDINHTIIVTYTFAWIIHMWSFHVWCENDAMWNVSKIFKNTKFLGPRNYFAGSVTGSWLYHTDSQEYFLCFERLIDAPAQISRKWRKLKKRLSFKACNVIYDVIYTRNCSHNPAKELYTYSH